MADGSQTYWRGVPADLRLLLNWDGECVVYHCKSGDTHLLDEATGQLLTLLSLDYQSTRTLAEGLARCWDELLDDALLSDTLQVLYELERLDLAQRQP